MLKAYKVFLLIMPLLSFGKWGCAQSLTPQAVHSCGSTFTQSNGSLSFTVGELVIIPQVDSSGNSLNSGFTAGATITTISIDEPDPTVIDMKVFPNPVTDKINISVAFAKVDRALVVISDVGGKEAYRGNLISFPGVIELETSSLVSGTYILSVIADSGSVLGTYKLIKK